jgi:hypothetical protein
MESKQNRARSFERDLSRARRTPPYLELRLKVWENCDSARPIDHV